MPKPRDVLGIRCLGVLRVLKNKEWGLKDDVKERKGFETGEGEVFIYTSTSADNHGQEVLRRKEPRGRCR